MTFVFNQGVVNTTMTPDDLKFLIAEEQGCFNDYVTDDDLVQAEDHHLASDLAYCPVFHYFHGVGIEKQDYVWETKSSINGWQDKIYHIPDRLRFDCEDALQIAAKNWIGNYYENLSLYRLDVTPPKAARTDKNVCIWIDYHSDPYEEDYQRNHFINVFNHIPMQFSTFDAALHYIGEQMNDDKAEYGSDVILPTYHIVKI